MVARLSQFVNVQCLMKIHTAWVLADWPFLIPCIERLIYEKLLDVVLYKSLFPLCCWLWNCRTAHQSCVLWMQQDVVPLWWINLLGSTVLVVLANNTMWSGLFALPDAIDKCRGEWPLLHHVCICHWEANAWWTILSYWLCLDEWHVSLRMSYDRPLLWVWFIYKDGIWSGTSGRQPQSQGS